MTIISKRITSVEAELANRNRRRTANTGGLGAFYSRLNESAVSAIFEPRESILEAVTEFRQAVTIHL